MIDREKVIKGLESLHDRLLDVAKQDAIVMLDVSMVADAIVLLKEQEAVKPILEQDSMVCGVCGHEVIWQKMLGEGIWADEKLDYCPHCGRKVKWNDLGIL